MRGVDTRNEEEQQEGHVRTQWEGRPSASQGERPHGNKPPSTLTVDFQPLRLWEGEFLLLGLRSLRYSVTAAWADLLLRLLLYSTLSTPVHLSKFQFPCFHCRGTWSSQKKKKRIPQIQCEVPWALLGKQLHMHTQLLSCVRLSLTPWTVAYQAPLEVHGSFQARILGWVAISSLKESSCPRDRIYVSCLAGGFFRFITTVPPEKPILVSENLCKTSSLCK